MDNVRYTAKRLAEIVGATPKQVEGALGRKDGFAPEDLPVAPREAAARRRSRSRRASSSSSTSRAAPGKTSLSSSYAYRLAERGYRVLVIDLDSQGHATKCLGKEGGELRADAARRAHPQGAARRGHRPDRRCPGLSLVPANLAMSTIDLALMPLAGREFRLRNALQGFAAKLRLRGDRRAAVVRAPQPERAHGGGRPRHPGARRLPLLRRPAAPLRDDPGARAGPLAPAREHLHRA